MKALPWFRLYTEMIEDEKLGLLAFEDRWHYVALLCLKGKGLLDAESDPEMLQRKVALKMGLTCAELEKAAMRLSRMKLIDFDTFQPCAWNDRQMQSETSAERTKAYRERMKRHSDVTVTAQETETEKEEEKENKKAKKAAVAPSTFVLPDWINQEHWDIWRNHPKHRRATDAQKQLAVTKLGKWRDAGLDHATALENAAMNGWQGIFPPDHNQPIAARNTTRNDQRAATLAGLTNTGEPDDYHATDRHDDRFNPRHGDIFEVDARLVG